MELSLTGQPFDAISASALRASNASAVLGMHATNASCQDRRPGGQVELQEVLSAIGIPKRLSKMPITMGYTPGATRTSVSLKRMCYVKLEVQRAQRVTWR